MNEKDKAKFQIRCNKIGSKDWSICIGISHADCGENIGDYDIPIHNAIIIPKGATNGNVIRDMFPDVIVEESEDVMHLKYPTVNSDPLFFVQISKRLWNAPYKEEVK